MNITDPKRNFLGESCRKKIAWKSKTKMTHTNSWLNIMNFKEPWEMNTKITSLQNLQIPRKQTTNTQKTKICGPRPQVLWKEQQKMPLDYLCTRENYIFKPKLSKRKTVTVKRYWKPSEKEQWQQNTISKEF